MEILSIDEIKKRLQDRTISVVHSNTGLSYGTLQSLKRGDSVKHTVGTLKIISDYLKDGEV